MTVEPAVDAGLGRQIAAKLGVPADAPVAWVAYGAACRQAIGKGKAVPDVKRFLTAPLPARAPALALSPPPPPPAPPRIISLDERCVPAITPQAQAKPPAARRSSPRSRSASSRRTPAPVPELPGAQGSAAARAVLAGAPRSRLGATVRRGLYGATWRLLLVMAAMAGGLSLLHPTLAEVAGVLGGGLVLGLWHRHWGIARIWRWTVLAAALGWAGPALGASYGEVIAGTVGLSVVAPWPHAWRAAR